MTEESGSPDILQAVPPELEPTPLDDRFAEWFVDVTRLIEACPRQGKVALLLSTCRNQWMTVNNVFYDIKQVLTLSSRRDPASEALSRLELGDLKEAREAAERGLMLLSQAREKFEVWVHRHGLLEEFEHQLEALRLDVRSERTWRRLNGWFEGQKSGRTWGVPLTQARYLALNVDDFTEAAPRLDHLQEIERRLRMSMLIVTHAVRLLHREDALVLFDAEPEGERRDGTKGRTPEATWASLLEVLRDGARSVEATWSTDADGNGRLSFTNAEIVLPAALPEQRQAILADLRLRARLVVDHVRDDLLESFRPNVAEKPLPDPYVLDLRPQHSLRDGVREFEVTRHRVIGNGPADVAKIAVLESGMPESAYSHTEPDLYVYDRDASEGANHARDIALAAISSAAAQGASVLVMPEVFLPRACQLDVFAAAEAENVLLVTGLEYDNIQGRAINEVAVVSNGLTHVVHQRKQRPAVYESRGKTFDSDGRLTIIHDSPIGNFAVVVCSDYLELDLVWELSSQPERLDALIVAARNPLPEVFERLAVADAVRLHAYVVVVNTAPFGSRLTPPSGAGTLVAAPTHPKSLMELERVPLPVDWSEIAAPMVAFADLSIAELRRLDTERTGRGFLHPPEFPRRG